MIIPAALPGDSARACLKGMQLGIVPPPARSGAVSKDRQRHMWWRQRQQCSTGCLMFVCQLRLLAPSSCPPCLCRCSTAWDGRWRMRWRRQQRGLERYNCADSLDRTNAASYFAAVQVGKG